LVTTRVAPNASYAVDPIVQVHAQAAVCHC
jgi:hypothetical protein